MFDFRARLPALLSASVVRVGRRNHKSREEKMSRAMRFPNRPFRWLGVSAVSLIALGIAVGGSGSASADHNQGRNNLRADPWVFVGTATQCGGAAGSKIVTSAWLPGMGLPDDGTPNSQNPPASGADPRDPHHGLLLNKNGPTTDCSSSGAEIEGFRRGRSATISELGFDYRVGGHCGAGAPRFNVTSTSGFTYFLGCIHGAQTPAPQDPTQWTRVRFSATEGTVFPANPAAPPFVFGPGGTQVKSIDIVFDEGTEVASPSGPTGPGLAVLDKIDVNGDLITSQIKTASAA
jgi:hypothetical protein